jgi:hypothetical protein
MIMALSANHDADTFAAQSVAESKLVAPLLLRALTGQDDPPPNDGLTSALEIEVLALILHVMDRHVFQCLGPQRRDEFMNELLVATKRLLPSPLAEGFADTYNSRNQYYGRMSKLYPPTGENLKGTVFWEFAKAMASVYANSNPAAVMAATLLAMESEKFVRELLNSEHVR